LPHNFTRSYLRCLREQARRREETRCCPASQRDPVCGQL
jgi:hypothetical protein